MQKRHQIIELFLVEDDIKRRHVAPTAHDRVADVPIGRRHSARQSLLSEHANERRPLQRLFLISVVTDGAARLKDFSSMLLLNGQRASRCRRRRITRGEPERNKTNREGHEQLVARSQPSIIDRQHEFEKLQSKLTR